MSGIDALVVGGGHNGLTTAILLARTGRKVAVLEKRPLMGGLAAAEEFHPGFRSCGLLHDTALVRPSIVEMLGLTQHGLTLRSQASRIFCPHPTQDALVLSADPSQAVVPGQTEAWAAWLKWLDKVRPALTRLLNSAPPDLSAETPADLLKMASTGLIMRTLGTDTMMELLRIWSLPALDWLQEHFTSDHLAAALALPALEGTWMGPWSPGSAGLVLMRESMATPGVQGGSAALTRSLVEAAKAQGVLLRTSTEVTSLVVKEGRVCGAMCGDDLWEAPVVATSCDPKRALLGLVPPRHLPPKVAEGLRVWRTRGTSAKVHVGIKGEVPWAQDPGFAVRQARVAPSTEAIERAFDQVKYDTFAKNLVLDVHVPTLDTPLLAPEGHHVLSISVPFVPYANKAGWGEAQKALLLDKVLSSLETVAPGLRGQVVAQEVLSPHDLESRYSLTEGHVHHGEHAMDQLSFMRPVASCGYYSTPLEGLFLCGSGSHPGGGITCAPGALAAAAILKQAK